MEKKEKYKKELNIIINKSVNEKAMDILFYP
jgi:hypothetical protein